METNKTKVLDSQTNQLVQEYEFRVNVTNITRPTLETRRRGAWHWVELALIPPGSNFYTIMLQTLVNCATFLTDIVDADAETNGGDKK